jgi:hypothetical protein
MVNRAKLVRAHPQVTDAPVLHMQLGAIAILPLRPAHDGNLLRRLDFADPPQHLA